MKQHQTQALKQNSRLTAVRVPQDQQLTQSVVLKADAIKYVMAFRSQLRPDLVRTSLPHLAGLLRSPAVVVHSYAAMAIEKLLMVRTADKTPL